jgi:hypothetical protein
MRKQMPPREVPPFAIRALSGSPVEALKFTSHFQWIAIAMNPPEADTTLWDEEDGFYYDVMRMPDGSAIQLKVRPLVGLLPLCAATVFDPQVLDSYPALIERIAQFIRQFSDAVPSLTHLPGPSRRGGASPRSSTRGGCGGSCR